MVSFDGFSPEAGVPLYTQIVRHIKRGVAAGAIAHGDELPSRRVLSALLGVNPNTVQKAYRILEEEGLIQSHTGAKSCMVLDGGQLAAIRRELVSEQVCRVVDALRQMGVSKEEALALLEQHWKEEPT